MPEIPRKLGTALRRVDHATFSGFWDHYQRLLARELPPCRTLLDVGCGKESPIRSLAPPGLRRRTVGVDIHEPDLRESRRLGIHDNYVVLDVSTLGSAFKPASFDCVLASDLIEHLPKHQGERLIESMERVARRRVLIFTPNGFLEQPPDEDNPWQEHVSGWTVAEFRKRGYRVVGVHGWKPLRTQYAEIALRPVKFWERVSWLSQPLLQKSPRWAFQLLAVKDIR